MDDALSTLAAAAGIEPRYWDIDGRLHETSQDTARRLLEALGLPGGTDSEIAASLAKLDGEQREEGLSPVVIAGENTAAEVAIWWPQKQAGANIRWVIDLETGPSISGDINIGSLPLQATHDLGTSIMEQRRLTLPPLPCGYHHLRLPDLSHTISDFIVCPRRCFLPPDFLAKKHWGVTAQLYAIRSKDNWGMGDFGDLGALAKWVAAAGADAVGLNPLHGLFLDTPTFASPYSPCSRLHLNPLYLEVAAIPDFIESAEIRADTEASTVNEAIKSLRLADLIDYSAVASLKLGVLEKLHKHFLRRHAADDRGDLFRRYVEDRGATLRGFAVFQALTEHFATHKWGQWPAPYRNPSSREVEAFAEIHKERISFFQYLQWQSELQLSAAAAHATTGGMRLGLYRDLAVGIDVDGADHWADQQSFMGGARIGAPPDPFNETGQEWGVVPFNPRSIRSSGYAPFISMLRANMQRAGALRVDHIMGWERLFVIPAGGMPTDGAYVRFPYTELMAVAALESHRNRCLVVGEDLGTVPPGFRERLASADVLSCRVLFFEREGERFHRPAELPKMATVSATTHDLATLRGYWMGDDLKVKAAAGIFHSAEDEERAWRERARDIELLLQAITDEGLLPNAGRGEGKPEWAPELTHAIYAYLARSEPRLLMVQLSDLGNELRQVNLPGTTTAYPNWRLRLERSLDELAKDGAIAENLATIAGERR